MKEKREKRKYKLTHMQILQFLIFLMYMYDCYYFSSFNIHIFVYAIHNIQQMKNYLQCRE